MLHHVPCLLELADMDIMLALCSVEDMIEIDIAMSFSP